MSFFRNFKGAIVCTVFALVAAFLYGGLRSDASTSFAAAAVAAFVTTGFLGVLEFTFSFDNAVVNAKYLQKLDSKWQRWFLTVGMLIAVVGMRLLFPLIVVGLTAHLSPVHAIQLAFQGGSIDTPGTYAYELHQAHPAIAGFGGIFLLMIFLDFAAEERELTWLTWLEKPLAAIGKLDQLSVVIALIVLAVISKVTGGEEARTVLFSGACGLALYLVVNALGALMEVEEDEDAEAVTAAGTAVVVGKQAAATLIKQTGKAALMTVLFLEVLDASFSFDGVIGAFAITADPIIIALGLGFIGAAWVRALTVFFVNAGTLDEYEYLEHGAHWSIGILAVVLLATINHEAPEWLTGMIGVIVVGAAFISSVVRNRHGGDDDGPLDAKSDDELVNV